MVATKYPVRHKLSGFQIYIYIYIISEIIKENIQIFDPWNSWGHTKVMQILIQCPIDCKKNNPRRWKILVKLASTTLHQTFLKCTNLQMEN